MAKFVKLTSRGSQNSIWLNLAHVVSLELKLDQETGTYYTNIFTTEPAKYPVLGTPADILKLPSIDVPEYSLITYPQIAKMAP